MNPQYFHRLEEPFEVSRLTLRPLRTPAGIAACWTPLMSNVRRPQPTLLTGAYR